MAWEMQWFMLVGNWMRKESDLRYARASSNQREILSDTRDEEELFPSINAYYPLHNY